MISTTIILTKHTNEPKHSVRYDFPGSDMEIPVRSLYVMRDWFKAQQITPPQKITLTITCE